MAERILSASRLVMEAPEADRDRTAHALSTASLEVHWTRESLINSSAVPEPALAAIYDRLLSELGSMARRVRIAHADEEVEDGVHRLAISVQLADESWIDLRVADPSSSRSSSFRLMASTTLMAVTIVLLSMISVRLLTAPLRSLATAAKRLGINVESAPMPETGPIEVRQAARAFNEMQGRIRKLIADRTNMLAAISHDLRTPITRLKLRAELVDDDSTREDIFRDLHEMEEMIDSVLSFLRQDADREEAKVVDLATILETVCDDLEDAGHDVVLVGDRHGKLKCRPLALKRAFSNLIDNAVRYGGKAVVKIAHEHDRLRVDIEDNGPGIPVSEQERVFAPFVRLETSRSRSTGGTGLGLTVARSILQAHGGEVVISNRDEGGLRVTVWLAQ